MCHCKKTVALSIAVVRWWVRRQVTSLIAIVCTWFECLAQALTLWNVAHVRSFSSVCIVNKAAAQGFIHWSIVEIGPDFLFDLDPSTTIESEQTIGFIV